MNQRELVREISDRTGETRMLTKEIVECMVDVISENILEGDKVSITRLGTFKKKSYKVRWGYDPYRQVKVQIPSSTRMIFSANKYLKQKLGEEETL